MAVLAPMPRAIDTSATLVNSGDRASPRKAYRRSRIRFVIPTFFSHALQACQPACTAFRNVLLDGKRAREVDMAQPTAARCSREDTESGRFERRQDGRADGIATLCDALDRNRLGEIEEVHLLERIDEPAFAHAVLPVPLELFAAVAVLRAVRQDFGDQIGGSPHLIPDDRQPLRRHEQHVRLEDQRALPIQDDVEGGYCYATELPRLDMVPPQPRDPEHERLM